MTVYACSDSWSTPAGPMHNLFADTDDEAFMSCMALGADPDSGRNGFYPITAAQLALAASWNVRIVDRLAASAWFKRRLQAGPN